MKIGIICPSEIAIRRFMPALQKCKDLIFAGVGVFSKEECYGGESISGDAFKTILAKEREKAKVFVEQYGGRIFDSYLEVISSSDIDAVYFPLPPALHYKWAKLAIEHGKHVFVEKPLTTSLDDTIDLINEAKKRNLAVHENYMYAFHSQLDAIDAIITSKELGDVRLFRIDFGFPMREANDFRYNKNLGGGSLIDAGGYTIHYATRLLGESAKLICAHLSYNNNFDVDIYGSASLINDDGDVAQISFGMDNSYKCDLEVWGSKGRLTTGRVLTAPDGFVPNAIIYKANESNQIMLPADDSFFKSIQHFVLCINDKNIRERRYKSILKQAKLVDEFIKMAK